MQYALAIALILGSAAVLTASFCRLISLDKKLHQYSFALMYYFFSCWAAAMIGENLMWIFEKPGYGPPNEASLLGVLAVTILCIKTKAWWDSGPPAHVNKVPQM